MVRLRCDGGVVQTLLTIEEIAELDLPSTPDLTMGPLLEMSLGDLPPLGRIAWEAPLIGIIDSGVNDHPLIEDILAEAIGVPDTLGTADGFGHGTRVAGIAVFGDLRGRLLLARWIAAPAFVPLRLSTRMASSGPTSHAQPDAGGGARLNAEFGCRIFVVALGDRTKIYDGGKVGAWAATLGTRGKLDVVIVVSAGNRDAIRSGNRVEQAVTDYPDYLLEASNRLCEPAGAMNVITVGAVAHGNGWRPASQITSAFGPSP